MTTDTQRMTQDYLEPLRQMCQRRRKRKGEDQCIESEVKVPKGPDFKLFLTVKENKIALQQLIGEALLESAPAQKTVVMYRAFEDPLDVRSSDPPPPNLDDLESDHVNELFLVLCTQTYTDSL